MSEMMYQPPPHPPAMTSSPQQIAYPQGISLGASGWTTAPPPGHGVAVHPLQFVGLPFPFMSQAAVMAVPQPYRVPYHFIRCIPGPPLAPVPPQAGAYQTSPNPDLYQIAAQKLQINRVPHPDPGQTLERPFHSWRKKRLMRLFPHELCLIIFFFISCPLENPKSAYTYIYIYIIYGEQE
ncbi:hypothetical protein C3747_104g142 [Trypanosoma cruzi]|uniref:Uncharacterized protein n=1 Tax=Trypanosoma cruzi TaxID=5693 RepID=A0A2V2WFU9_TRYCR|nr:hypothetical protein C3747_104g142 [Trypanosoma cruzi]